MHDDLQIILRVQCQPKIRNSVQRYIMIAWNTKWNQYVEYQLSLSNDMIKKTIKAKKVIGRPTKYCDELIDEICARLSAGESLNRILKSRSEMPAFITIYQ